MTNFINFIKSDAYSYKKRKKMEDKKQPTEPGELVIIRIYSNKLCRSMWQGKNFTMKINIEVRILNQLHFIYFIFLIDLYLASQRNEKNTSHMFNVIATDFDFFKGLSGIIYNVF